MKYPKMKGRIKRRITIPSLAGGINLRDSLNLCNDNQLTDCLNMHFRDGVLKTRGGLLTQKEAGIVQNTPPGYKIAEINTKFHNDIIKTDEKGRQQKLVSYKIDYRDQDEKSLGYNLGFLWCGEDTLTELPKISFINTETENKGRINLNYLICQYSGAIYCFIKNQINQLDEKGQPIIETQIMVLKNNSNKWEKPEFYVPLVLNHCKPNGHLVMGVNEIIEEGGVMWEAFNLLSGSYKIIYSTVNKDLFDDYKTNHIMSYSLYYNVNDFIGSTITAKLTTDLGTHTHSVKITNTGFNRETTSEDGYYMSVQGRRVVFYSDNNYTEISKVEASEYIEDNLEITAPCPCYDDIKEMIFNMTKSEWFGGAATGVNGGNRLFLGGSIKESQKSLIMWSGVENPLYFPENAYSYVGNSVSKITAFGRQEDMMVIFKDSELFYTKYIQNTNIVNRGLTSKQSNDYKASKINFELNQIHSSLGCDCPDTVQLCRNRLVWTNQNGKIYSLTNRVQYSEGNVFVASEMIGRKLKKEADLKNAYSVDWENYYVVFSKEHIYLMDYNSYGYQNISSYSKTEDANIRIPWYYWEIDTKDGMFFTANDSLCCVQASLSDNKLCVALLSLTGRTDNGKPIKSMAQTKFFDFSEPNKRKNIESIGVTLGNNGGSPIEVSYITESGKDRDTIILTNDDIENRSAGYITSQTLNPAIRSAVRFGVCFECDGVMAIEGINISYKLLGEAR